jgi:iron complex outermembrane receptor protein
MNGKSLKGVLLIGSALAGFAAAAPVHAQDADEDGATGGDIVVTARRVEERLQDVPISISVVTNEQLASRNISSPVELATYTPSLTSNQRYGPEKSSFVIRGFVQEPLTSPSVGVYFADVVAPRSANGTTSGNGAGPGTLFDLQNIQVLKGPQGTLFGRNTTGGAVLLVPKKPTDRLEGYVEASAGNFDMLRGQAVLNIPLADTFKVRLGIDRNKRDGYMKNRSGVGPKTYNDVNYYALRLGVLADLTPDLENYLLVNYSDSDSNGYGARIARCNPAATGNAARTSPAACDQIARQAARGDGPLDIENSNPDPYVKDRTLQIINTTTWKATDTLTIKNIVSYSEFRQRASFNLNSDNFFITGREPGMAGSPLIGQRFYHTMLNPVPGKDNSAQSTFTEELQFQGTTGDGSLVWQVGGYMEMSRSLGFNPSYTAVMLSCTDLQQLLCTNPFGTGSVSNAKQKMSFDNYGIYAQADYKLTEQLTVTGGIRYTIDKTVGIGEGTRRTFNASGLTGQVCNDTLRFQGPRSPTGAATPLQVTNSAQCHNEFTNKSEKPTWVVGMQYKPVDELMLYGKWSRGYRQGSINLGAIGIESWGPEKVYTYELGAKANWRGAVPGYLNLAGFYNDFRNQQLVATLIGKPGSGVSGAAAIVNAGKSRIWGIEAEGSATLFDDLRIDAGYTYLNTELLSITPPVLPADTPFQPNPNFSADVGEDLPLSPRHRVTASATYTLPLDAAIGRLSVGATFVHTAAQTVTSARTSPLYKLPATDLLNLNADWKGVMGSPVDVSFFMTNVTNEIYPVGIGSNWASGGYESVLYAAPRMWGFRLRYSFGN